MSHRVVSARLLGGLAAVAAAVAAAPVSSAVAAPEFSESVVWDFRENGRETYHVQGLAVTNDDTVLAFSEGRHEAADDGAHDIVLKRSADGGATWGAEQVVEPSPDGQAWANPTPVVDRASGRIVLFYALNDGTNNASRVYRRTSSDDGRTWSARTEVTSLFAGDRHEWTFHLPGPGHGIQLADGRLVVQVWHRRAVTFPAEQRRYGVTTVHSDDGGLTWQAGGTVPVDPAYPINESRLLERSDGALVVNGRYAAGGTHSRITAVSLDGGETWAPPVLDRSVRPGVTIDSGFARLTGGPDSAAVDRVLFSRPDSATRSNMTVGVSYDEGYSYPFERVVTSGGAQYSDLAALPGGDVLLLYGKGSAVLGGGSVAAARFNLEWLTQGRDSIAGGPDLEVVTTEAETAARPTSSGDPVRIVADVNSSAGALLRYAADAAGDHVELTLDVPAAGTYLVKARWKWGGDRGRVQASIAGAAQGCAFDPLSTTALAYQEVDLGRRTFATAGRHAIRFTVTGRSSGSTGHAMLIDYVSLTRDGVTTSTCSP